MLTVGDPDPLGLVDYAKAITPKLRSQFVRVEGDCNADPEKAKIADAETGKVHTMPAVGLRDLLAGGVSVRLHGKGNVSVKPSKGGGNGPGAALIFSRTRQKGMRQLGSTDRTAGR